jgi:hypothetical protein
MTDPLPSARTIRPSRLHPVAAGQGAKMRRSIVIRILVLNLAVTALSVPAAWADHVPDQSTEHVSGSQPLIVPTLHSTEHGSPAVGSQPLIVPVSRSTEHGGTVEVPAPAVIVQTGGGFDWTSAAIGAVTAAGLALVLLGAGAMRGRRTRIA